ncbi:hypothetical protein [Streptomyces olivoreticuli]|uniref:hypothetical protein n=1 Tax=Streptomyces olivoreticuli TaxID=68246 RepID=UPI0013C2F54E|nr:hypothetical protein [Streptomyces olivoreticuli]
MTDEASQNLHEEDEYSHAARSTDQAGKREGTTMRIARPLSVVIAACAVVALSAAAPSTETPRSPGVAKAAATAPKAAAGITGIGWEIHTAVDTGMYSGPGLSTPRVGTAWAGDNIAGICQINDNRGNRMILGIERPGRNGIQWANTVGYIWDADIIGDTSGWPACGTA